MNSEPVREISGYDEISRFCYAAGFRVARDPGTIRTAAPPRPVTTLQFRYVACPNRQNCRWHWWIEFDGSIHKRRHYRPKPKAIAIELASTVMIEVDMQNDFGS
jgi:hypothetical protein